MAEHYTEPAIERIRDWVFAPKTLQCRTEMKTADFRGELMPNGQIAVQPEIAAQVPPGEQIQVVLQWGATEDETAWRMAGRQQFESAYAADDSISELLIHDPSAR